LDLESGGRVGGAGDGDVAGEGFGTGERLAARVDEAGEAGAG